MIRYPLNKSMMRPIFINLILLLATLVIPDCCDAQKIEDTRLTMELKNRSLKEAIKLIEELTPFRFLAKAEDIEGEVNVTIGVYNQPLDRILTKLLEGRNLSFEQIDRNIVIKKRRKCWEETHFYLDSISVRKQ